jgi:hypothetical protein
MRHSGFCNKLSRHQEFEFDKMQTDQGDTEP